MPPIYRLIVDLPAEDIGKEVTTQDWPPYGAWFTDAEGRMIDFHWSKMHRNRQEAEVFHRNEVAAAIKLATYIGAQRHKEAWMEDAVIA